MTKTIIGIDIAKQKFDVAYKTTDKRWRQGKFSNTIPGIGEVNAWNLLAELPDLGTFKCAKQLAAYAGLNPSIRTSESSVKCRQSMSKVGHQLLRKVLFLPATSLMGRKTAMKSFIDRLRSRGKKGKEIVGAVMHKLLHIIFGVMKKQVVFQG
jgi:transposase